MSHAPKCFRDQNPDAAGGFYLSSCHDPTPSLCRRENMEIQQIYRVDIMVYESRGIKGGTAYVYIGPYSR